MHHWIRELLRQGISGRQSSNHYTRRSRKSPSSQPLQFTKLEPRQLLAAAEIASWEFSDLAGTSLQAAAIAGSQASDVQWRYDRAAVQTADGKLNVTDDGSNQYFTDLRQESNTNNLNPLDLSAENHLRLHVNYSAWNLTNADDGTIQRFDLKRQGGTVHGFIRLQKTASGPAIQFMFNNKYVAIPMPTISDAVAATLDLDLDANTATYHVGGTSGTLSPTDSAITLSNETLNFGVFNNFLGSVSSADFIAIDSMGLSAIPPVTRSIQSGNWTDANNWDNGIPDGSSRAIVSQGTNIALDGSDHVVESLVVHGTLNVIEDASDRSLTSNWIHVNSGGVFQVGSAANRFDDGQFTVTLTGTNINADHLIETATGKITVANNDGFLMSGTNGQLQFFGEDETTFTKLAATASAGATSITVENVIERNFDGTTSAVSDGEIDWQVGDEIVIASSSRDYSEEDKRTITAVSNNGSQTVFSLDTPLDYRHYGEVETYDNGLRTWDLDLRAEVALLSRSITIQGTQDTDAAFGDRANFGTAASQNFGIGGHTMIMDGSGQVTVDGVRFDRMGQTGQLGRYPIHWHLAGDRTGDSMRNSSVTNSNNRGTTVHGTHGLLLEGNVFHDIHGHGLFMEDGVETDNQYLNNIALGIHRVGGDNNALSDPFIVDTHDVVFQDSSKEVSSAAFWITNPDNVWIGNISAGSEGTGFWFVLPSEAIGVSKDNPLYAGVDASRTDLDTFIHNSSHTSELGLVIDRGADVEIEIGDPIFQGNGQLAGRYYPPTSLHISHFTAYKQGGAAIYTNVDDGYTFDEFMYADNFISSFQLRTKTNSNTLYVGNSRGNADLTEETRGHALYNGLAILKDSHFAGFADSNTYFFAAESAPKRQHYQIEGATFENDGTANAVRYDNPYGSALNNRQLHVAGIDVDGSFTSHIGGGAGSTIVPNHPFFHDANDIAPAGWDFLVTDEFYATIELTAVQGLSGQIVQTRITNPVGSSVTMNGGQNLMLAAVKLGWGDYSVEFPQGLGAFADEGFDFALQMWNGDQYVSADNKANVFRFAGIGSQLAPQNTPRVDGIAAVRSATENVYDVDSNGDLWMKVFYDQGIDFFDDVVFSPAASIVTRGVSYGNTTANYGQDAIDTTKQPLLPGETATFANYTSHSRGLNRVEIGVSLLPGNALTTDDFEFRVGNSATPNTWLLLDDTSSIPLPTISVTTPTAGVSSVVLAWPDNAIENNWLQVNLLASATTGLTATDTFYFGNAIAESGNDPSNTRVDLVDVALTRSNQTGFTSASIDNPYDFNRDGRVNLLDVAIARSNQTGFTSLQLISTPSNDTSSGNRADGSSDKDGFCFGKLASEADTDENGIDVLMALATGTEMNFSSSGPFASLGTAPDRFSVASDEQTRSADEARRLRLLQDQAMVQWIGDN